MRSSLRRFHKNTFFYAFIFLIQPWMFLISIAPCFAWCKHLLLPCIFYYNRTFFRGRFCINHTRTRRKVPENKVSKQQDFISKDFLFRGFFFHGTFLVPKFRTLFPKKKISENFFGGYRSANGRKSKKLANSILTLKALT